MPGRSCCFVLSPKMSAHFRRKVVQDCVRKSLEGCHFIHISEFSFTRLGVQNSFPTMALRLSLYRSSLWHICIAYDGSYWRFICSILWVLITWKHHLSLTCRHKFKSSSVTNNPSRTRDKPCKTQKIVVPFFDTSHWKKYMTHIPECDYHPVPPRNLSHKSVQNLYERDVHHPKWIHWENFQCPRDWWHRQNNYSRKWIFKVKQSPKFWLSYIVHIVGWKLV